MLRVTNQLLTDKTCETILRERENEEIVDDMEVEACANPLPCEDNESVALLKGREWCENRHFDDYALARFQLNVLRNKEFFRSLPVLTFATVSKVGEEVLKEQEVNLEIAIDVYDEIRELDIFEKVENLGKNLEPDATKSEYENLVREKTRLQLMKQMVADLSLIVANISKRIKKALPWSDAADEESPKQVFSQQMLDFKKELDTTVAQLEASIRVENERFKEFMKLNPGTLSASFNSDVKQRGGRIMNLWKILVDFCRNQLYRVFKTGKDFLFWIITSISAFIKFLVNGFNDFLDSPYGKILLMLLWKYLDFIALFLCTKGVQYYHGSDSWYQYLCYLLLFPRYREYLWKYLWKIFYYLKTKWNSIDIWHFFTKKKKRSSDEIDVDPPPDSPPGSSSGGPPGKLKTETSEIETQEIETQEIETQESETENEENTLKQIVANIVIIAKESLSELSNLRDRVNNLSTKFPSPSSTEIAKPGNYYTDAECIEKYLESAIERANDPNLTKENAEFIRDEVTFNNSLVEKLRVSFSIVLPPTTLPVPLIDNIPAAPLPVSSPSTKKLHKKVKRNQVQSSRLQKTFFYGLVALTGALTLYRAQNEAIIKEAGTAYNSALEGQKTGNPTWFEDARIHLNNAIIVNNSIPLSNEGAHILSNSAIDAAERAIESAENDLETKASEIEPLATTEEVPVTAESVVSTEEVPVTAESVVSTEAETGAVVPEYVALPETTSRPQSYYELVRNAFFTKTVDTEKDFLSNIIATQTRENIQAVAKLERLNTKHLKELEAAVEILQHGFRDKNTVLAKSSLVKVKDTFEKMENGKLEMNFLLETLSPQAEKDMKTAENLKNIATEIEEKLKELESPTILIPEPEQISAEKKDLNITLEYVKDTHRASKFAEDSEKLGLTFMTVQKIEEAKNFYNLAKIQSDLIPLNHPLKAKAAEAVERAQIAKNSVENLARQAFEKGVAKVKVKTFKDKLYAVENEIYKATIGENFDQNVIDTLDDIYQVISTDSKLFESIELMILKMRIQEKKTALEKINNLENIFEQENNKLNEEIKKDLPPEKIETLCFKWFLATEDVSVHGIALSNMVPNVAKAKIDSLLNNTRINVGTKELRTVDELISKTTNLATTVMQQETLNERNTILLQCFKKLEMAGNILGKALKISNDLGFLQAAELTNGYFNDATSTIQTIKVLVHLRNSNETFTKARTVDSLDTISEQIVIAEHEKEQAKNTLKQFTTDNVKILQTLNQLDTQIHEFTTSLNIEKELLIQQKNRTINVKGNILIAQKAFKNNDEQTILNVLKNAIHNVEIAEAASNLLIPNSPLTLNFTSEVKAMKTSFDKINSIASTFFLTKIEGECQSARSITDMKIIILKITNSQQYLQTSNLILSKSDLSNALDEIFLSEAYLCAQKSKQYENINLIDWKVIQTLIPKVREQIQKLNVLKAKINDEDMKDAADIYLDEIDNDITQMLDKLYEQLPLETEKFQKACTGSKTIRETLTTTYIEQNLMSSIQKSTNIISQLKIAKTSLSNIQQISTSLDEEFKSQYEELKSQSEEEIGLTKNAITLFIDESFSSLTIELSALKTNLENTPGYYSLTENVQEFFSEAWERNMVQRTLIEGLPLLNEITHFKNAADDSTGIQGIQQLVKALEYIKRIKECLLKGNNILSTIQSRNAAQEAMQKETKQQEANAQALIITRINETTHATEQTFSQFQQFSQEKFTSLQEEALLCTTDNSENALVRSENAIRSLSNHSKDTGEVLNAMRQSLLQIMDLQKQLSNEYISVTNSVNSVTKRIEELYSYYEIVNEQKLYLVPIVHIRSSLNALVTESVNSNNIENIQYNVLPRYHSILNEISNVFNSNAKKELEAQCLVVESNIKTEEVRLLLAKANTLLPEANQTLDKNLLVQARMSVQVATTIIGNSVNVVLVDTTLTLNDITKRFAQQETVSLNTQAKAASIDEFCKTANQAASIASLPPKVQLYQIVDFGEKIEAFQLSLDNIELAELKVQEIVAEQDDAIPTVNQKNDAKETGKQKIANAKKNIKVAFSQTQDQVNDYLLQTEQIFSEARAQIQPMSYTVKSAIGTNMQKANTYIRNAVELRNSSLDNDRDMKENIENLKESVTLLNKAANAIQKATSTTQTLNVANIVREVNTVKELLDRVITEYNDIVTQLQEEKDVEINTIVKFFKSLERPSELSSLVGKYTTKQNLDSTLEFFSKAENISKEAVKLQNNVADLLRTKVTYLSLSVNIIVMQTNESPTMAGKKAGLDKASYLITIIQNNNDAIPINLIEIKAQTTQALLKATAVYESAKLSLSTIITENMQTLKDFSENAQSKADSAETLSKNKNSLLQAFEDTKTVESNFESFNALFQEFQVFNNLDVLSQVRLLNNSATISYDRSYNVRLFIINSLTGTASDECQNTINFRKNIAVNDATVAKNNTKTAYTTLGSVKDYLTLHLEATDELVQIATKSTSQAKGFVEKAEKEAKLAEDLLEVSRKVDHITNNVNSWPTNTDSPFVRNKLLEDWKQTLGNNVKLQSNFLELAKNDLSTNNSTEYLQSCTNLISTTEILLKTIKTHILNLIDTTNEKVNLWKQEYTHLSQSVQSNFTPSEKDLQSNVVQLTTETGSWKEFQQQYDENIAIDKVLAKINFKKLVAKFSEKISTFQNDIQETLKNEFATLKSQVQTEMDNASGEPITLEQITESVQLFQRTMNIDIIRQDIQVVSNLGILISDQKDVVKESYYRGNAEKVDEANKLVTSSIEKFNALKRQLQEEYKDIEGESIKGFKTSLEYYLFDKRIQIAKAKAEEFAALAKLESEQLQLAETTAVIPEEVKLNDDVNFEKKSEVLLMQDNLETNINNLEESIKDIGIVISENENNVDDVAIQKAKDYQLRIKNLTTIAKYFKTEAMGKSNLQERSEYVNKSRDSISKTLELFPLIKQSLGFKFQSTTKGEQVEILETKEEHEREEQTRSNIAYFVIGEALLESNKNFETYTSKQLVDFYDKTFKNMEFPPGSLYENNRNQLNILITKLKESPNDLDLQSFVSQIMKTVYEQQLMYFQSTLVTKTDEQQIEFLTNIIHKTNIVGTGILAGVASGVASVVSDSTRVWNFIKVDPEDLLTVIYLKLRQFQAPNKDMIPDAKLLTFQTIGGVIRSVLHV
jgi:hypothetical protein